MKKKIKKVKKWFVANKKSFVNIGLGFVSLALAVGIVILSHSNAKANYRNGFLDGCQGTGRWLAESMGGTADEGKLLEFCVKLELSKEQN